MRIVTKTQPDLIVLEGLSFGSKGRSVTDLAGLHWLLRYRLYLGTFPFAVVTPQQNKKAATGNGNASKHQMIEAVQEFYKTNNDNIADAIHLARYGMKNYEELVEH